MDVSPKLENQIKLWADELGFIACGITLADAISEKDTRNFDTWIHLGFHGEMKYMENHREKRLQPTELIPGAKSIICLAYNYFSPTTSADNIQTPKFARYAWGEDYHRVVKDKVHLLMGKILEASPEFEGRGFTDSAPVMERQLAERAGLGWIGKNSLLLRKGIGSYFFLAEIICNLDLLPDNPMNTDHCGTCTACIDACPTQAIVQPQVVNSNLCISYQTIEKKGDSSLSVEEHQGWVYGCDICQEVCPWNRFSEPHNEPRFNAREFVQADSNQWKQWINDPDAFQLILKNTASERTGHRKILSEVRRQINS